MGEIRAVLFDNDGTLVDTHDLILASFRHATREVLGHALPDDVLMARVGTPLSEQMKDFTDDPALQEALLVSYRTHNHAIHDQAVALFPGVLEGLQALHEIGLPLGVVTSKLHALAWRGLEITGAAPYIDCMIGADDCPLFKPDPAPVALGAERLGVEPGACLYVGDSPFDMQAGRGAGCVTVAVTWGMFDRATLEAQQPDYIIDTMAELVQIACS